MSYKLRVHSSAPLNNYVIDAKNLPLLIEHKNGHILYVYKYDAVNQEFHAVVMASSNHKEGDHWVISKNVPSFREYTIYNGTLTLTQSKT